MRMASDQIHQNQEYNGPVFPPAPSALSSGDLIAPASSGLFPRYTSDANTDASFHGQGALSYSGVAISTDPSKLHTALFPLPLVGTLDFVDHRAIGESSMDLMTTLPRDGFSVEYTGTGESFANLADWQRLETNGFGFVDPLEDWAGNDREYQPMSSQGEYNGEPDR
jgi:hypothetical protein